MHSVCPTSTRSPSATNGIGRRRRRPVERADHRRLDLDDRRDGRRRGRPRRPAPAPGAAPAHRRPRSAARSSCLRTVILTPWSSIVSSPTPEARPCRSARGCVPPRRGRTRRRVASSRSVRPRSASSSRFASSPNSATSSRSSSLAGDALGLRMPSRSMRSGSGGRLDGERRGAGASRRAACRRRPTGSRASRPTPRPSGARTARGAPPGAARMPPTGWASGGMPQSSAHLLELLEHLVQPVGGAQVAQPGVELGDQPDRHAG